MLPPNLITGRRRPADAELLARLGEAAEKPTQKFQDRKPGDRYKSKWERLYAEELEARRLAGEILRWEYEPFGIRIDDGQGVRCIYWPDFAVWEEGKPMIFVELKGRGQFALRPVARAKFLAAKRLYPEFRFKCVQNHNGEWVKIL
jgi:hypothetical protein